MRSSAPLLLGNALHDPATPHSSAADVARRLGRHGVLRTYEGWGHGIYAYGDCTKKAIAGYLISLTLPARGTRCPAIAPEGARLPL